MAIPYTIRSRRNPSNLAEPKKFYAAPFYYGEVGIEKLVSEISHSTTLTASDIVAVLRALLDTIPKYLTMGFKIRLENFGLFRLSFSAHNKGKETMKDVKSKDIDKNRILFVPDAKLKKQIEKPAYEMPDMVRKELFGETEDESHSDSPANGNDVQA